VLMLVSRGKLGGEGRVVNPGYKKFFDVPHGMECKCRSEMGLVLALLLSLVRSGNPQICMPRCQRTSCIKSG